jgi:molybdenum cofactor cytidylyltransferase
MSDRHARVGAIVLAAGASIRMGRDKMLLTLGGESLVRRMTRRAIEAGFDPVIVVGGRDRNGIAASLQGLPCTLVHNPDAGPISGSLHLGLYAIPPDIQAVTIVLGDMPAVTTPMLRAVLQRYRDDVAPVVTSRYGEVYAPPLLFARRLFGELLACQGDGCGRRVLQQHLDEAAVVQWAVESLQDVDVLEDYETLRSVTGR